MQDIQTAELKTEIKELIIETLNIKNVKPEDIDNATPLFAKENVLGLDSIDGIELIMAVQKKYNVIKGDSFNTIVKKNYKIAAKAMIEAIDILSKNNYILIPNDDEKATYNTTPTFKEALLYRYRKVIFTKFFY